MMFEVGAWNKTSEKSRKRGRVRAVGLAWWRLALDHQCEPGSLSP